MFQTPKGRCQAPSLYCPCCNPVLCCTVNEAPVAAHPTASCDDRALCWQQKPCIRVPKRTRSRSKGCISQAVKQTCCCWNDQSNSSRQNRDHEQLLANRSFLLHRRCSARPDTSPAGRVKESTGIRHLISHLMLVEFARALNHTGHHMKGM